MNRLGLIVFAGAAAFVAGCGSRLASPSLNDYETCARAAQMSVAAWKEVHELGKSSAALERDSGSDFALTTAKIFVQEACYQTGIIEGWPEKVLGKSSL